MFKLVFIDVQFRFETRTGIQTGVNKADVTLINEDEQNTDACHGFSLFDGSDGSRTGCTFVA